MSRPLRIELAGGIYHVTSRGNRREDIYITDADRVQWLALFGQVCQRYNWRCHAYCLMSNHYHIVVETIEGNMSKGMRHLNGVYTQHFNRTHHRFGHVYQGRYKGILVDKDSYLLELSRYVVLNPVRAKMVNDVAQWPWSSYLIMLGEQHAPVWFEANWLLGQFGHQRLLAISKYIDFIREGIGLPSLWTELRQQIYLGDDHFVSRMQQLHDNQSDLSEIPRVQHRSKAKPLIYYSATYKNRNEAMMKAYSTGDYTMKEVAAHFNVHYATVSRAIKKTESTDV